MIARIGMPLVYVFLVLSFIRPLYGIAFYLCFEGMFNPQHYVPGYMEHHMGTVFLGVLTIAVLLHRRDFMHGRLLVALFCFFAVGLISTLINGLEGDRTPFYAQVQMLKCVATGVILTAYIRTRKEFFFLVGAMIVALNCNIIFQIMQCWFGYKTPTTEDVWWDPTRYGGFFADCAAPAGFYLVYLLPPLWYLFRHAKNWRLQTIWAGLLCLGALGVFLTLTRSAMLGMMLFGAIVFLKDLKKVSTLFVLALLVFTIANLAGDKWERETVTRNANKEMKLDSSSSVRFRYWSESVKLFIRNPLFGVGPGRVRDATREELGRKSPGSHNTPLSALAEFGLLGFIPFLYFPLMAWRSLNRLIRSKDTFFSEYAVYYRAGLLAFLFCSLFFTYTLFNIAWLALFLPLVMEKIYVREQQS